MIIPLPFGQPVSLLVSHGESNLMITSMCRQPALVQEGHKYKQRLIGIKASVSSKTHFSHAFDRIFEAHVNSTRSSLEI